MALGQTTKRAIGTACVGAGVIGLHVGAALFFAGHDPYTSTVFPPCPILALTGWQCPGCGGTRAAYSLFHGDLAGSWRMNPLVISAYLAGIALTGVVGAEWLSRPRLARALSAIAVTVVLGAGVYTGILRNLLGL